MKFMIPKHIPYVVEGVLTIDDLPVMSVSVSEWRKLELNGIVDLSIEPFKSKISTALSLLLRTEGPSLFNKSCTITIDFNDSELKIAAFSPISNTYSIRSVLECLDIVDVETKIVGGESHSRTRRPDETKVIAFYLPQFYPFAENDKWWGDGFTEWTNVVEAKPQLEGHDMPLLPADLGFYDLRVADSRRRQGQLAEEYGIDGFCYYFYWFNGRRIMREVLDQVLASGVPQNDFCLCWANESWSRRWDGSESAVDLLIRQEHNAEKDATLINDLLPYFLDNRYIKVDGSPMILVYRIDIMNDAEQVFAEWRRQAVKAGFPGLYITAARSFGLGDEDASFVDAIVDFPPHTANSTEIQSSLGANSDFSGKIYDYRQVVINAVTRNKGSVLNFPGVMPRWDNTPRKGNRSHIFWNSSPGAFKVWFSCALEESQQLPLAQRFLFVNSWNEWGEGAMLEPDRVYGRSYLEAIRSTRGDYTVGFSDSEKFKLISGLTPNGAERMMQTFNAEVHMVAQMMSWHRMKSYDAFRIGPPELITLSHESSLTVEGTMIIDHSSSKIEDSKITLRFGQPLALVGWCMTKSGAARTYDQIAYLVLLSENNSIIRYHIPISRWFARNDVAKYYGLNLSSDEVYFGFEVSVGTDNVPAGGFDCAVVESIDQRIYMAPCYTKIERVIS